MNSLVATEAYSVLSAIVPVRQKSLASINDRSPVFRCFQRCPKSVYDMEANTDVCIDTLQCTSVYSVYCGGVKRIRSRKIQ